MPMNLFRSIAVFCLILLAGCMPVQAPVVTAPAAALPTAATPLPTPPPVDVRLVSQLPSPDGNWTASTVATFPTGRSEYYQRFVVRATDGEPRYVVIDGWFPLALGYTIAQPLQWSPDSTRLYYTNRPTADGCGLLINGSDLFRIDVPEGTQQQLLPPVGGVIALAPDEVHVVYQPYGGRGLTITDLDTGVIRGVYLGEIIDDDIIGALTWSPDSTKFAFIVAHQPCSGEWAQSTSIYTVDRRTLRVAPHLLRDARLLVPVAWPVDDTLRLDTINGDGFLLNLDANTVTPVEQE